MKVPRRYRRYWRHPHGRAARRSRGFRRWCWRKGYLSPHFSRREAACRDGTPVPRRLRRRAQRHAFALERLRRLVGPLAPLSWYRTVPWNRSVGGASSSRHLQADATDFSSATVDRIGRSRFFAAAERVFAGGGVGRYPSGSAHVDSRGYRARW